MTWLIAALLLQPVLAQPADAPEGGVHYHVVGVEVDDRLNVRGEPAVDGPIIGTLAPDQRRVQATGRTARTGRTLWREIEHGRRLGWVSARFLVADAIEADAVAAPIGRRVALVVGNGAYGGGIARVAEAPGDGRAVASALRGVGFEVVDAVDANLAQMHDGLDRFQKQAEGAEIALVYFAGHGLRMGEESYLLPISARLVQPEDLEAQSVSVSALLAALEQAAPELGIVALDACRRNAVAASLTQNAESRGLPALAVEEGLAAHDPAPGTLIAYAARPGSVALGRPRGRSPFTQALLAMIRQPAVDVRVLFGAVREQVVSSTGGQQEPWIEEAVVGRHSLGPTPAAPE